MSLKIKLTLINNYESIIPKKTIKSKEGNCYVEGCYCFVSGVCWLSFLFVREVSGIMVKFVRCLDARKR